MLKTPFVATLLLSGFALLAVTPMASAAFYCYRAPDDSFSYCCDSVDQTGNPGSVEYLATGVLESVTTTECRAPGNAYDSAHYTVECVVNGNC